MNSLRLAIVLGVALAARPSTALANGFEFPSNGTESFARGSAWLARATDPLATYYNPAALARNGHGVSLSANLIWQKVCFQRRHNGSDPVLNGVTVGNADQLYYQSCNDGTPFPNPQITVQYRLGEKLGIGFAVLGPSAYGKTSYPTFVENTSLANSTLGQPVRGPAGSRYIVTDINNIVAWPQIGVGYEMAKHIRVGASFIWGVASIKFGNVAMGFNAGQGTNGQGRLNEKSDQDVAARVEAKDWFVPGFVLSALATVIDRETDGLDVAAWFHGSDSIRAKGKAELTAFLYTPNLQEEPNPTRQSTAPEQVKVDVPQPWQARAGVRYFRKRTSARGETTRLGHDPLQDEVFDVEFDFEYARDSQFKTLGVRFEQPEIKLNIQGIEVALPTDASVPHNWKDSFGLRLGGDYVVLPNKFALRAGAWYQSAFVEAKDMHLDFIGAQRLGLTAGGTFRAGPVDLQMGYGHIFFKTLDNGGQGQLKAITGSAPNFRSDIPVNGGRIKAKADIVSLGLVARW
ncbi:MAG: outer membrane protein transport protein [Myxococcales bacterium]|nr:outer membrane protein transport protein [Polyangiaceae bacterium]MDW8248582.1 outer membrane protein transport protein [Myxococcales bacterium]